ncbi:DUF1460 domain-containing protein [Mycobacterium sp. Y57]|nr:DUF1460 domain-containing protein [Mycolicibacterium xanthum]
MRTVAALLLAAVAVLAGGCAGSTPPETATSAETPTAAAAPPPSSTPAGRSRELATDPAQLADDLVHDEGALRDPAAPEDVLAAAAHRQQAAYRAIGHHPEWDPVVRPRIPASLLDVYDRNVDARRQLGSMTPPKDTVPAWRIVAPAPADELMGYYRESESASGVAWNYLAAINLIETAFGRVAGVSTAGAQGPMQFMPSTFAAYGEGGDILSPRDSIMAAGRYLAANGFVDDRDHALYRYNNSEKYVQAVHDYAAVIAEHPMAFAGYHRWDVYYKTTAGDVLLPIGYSQATRIPVTDYLASSASAPFEVRISDQSAQILERLLAVRRDASDAAPSQLSDVLSGQFLGTPYGANTLIGSATVPEQLVVELAKVDCFTYADYVEALKRAGNRDEFIDALISVRYKDGEVGFQTRKHFFTDWAAATPAVATDITASLSANAIQVPKDLNAKDSGGVYLPGLPVVPRTVSYIPSRYVDDGVLDQLRTGDYIGAYADDGGLDVTHVGIFVAGPDEPVLRNASSLSANNAVVDSPLRAYLQTVPGVVVLRPVA